MKPQQRASFRRGRRLLNVVLLPGMLLTALLFPQRAGAAFIFTYSGTIQRTGNDPASINGADFTLVAVFPSTPYIDNGLGQPSLPLIREDTTFTISGAPLPSMDGPYAPPFKLSMLPTLGGAFETLPSNPLQFTRVDLRLSVNLSDLFGGNGLGAAIGDTPMLSHFPTSISAPTIRALPHNTLYNVTNPSISVADSSVVIPEPSSVVIWSVFAAVTIGFMGWRRGYVFQSTSGVGP